MRKSFACVSHFYGHKTLSTAASSGVNYESAQCSGFSGFRVFVMSRSKLAIDIMV